MNEKEPLVSIIVPVYNVEKYLQKCIDSIVNQSYKNIEIILVNDGSTDNSLQICNLNKEKDSRIILINKKNGGLSDARNAGIDIHRGKYIVFVDSDDYIHKNMIKNMLELAQQKDADIVECGIKYVNEEAENVFDDVKREIEYRKYNHEESILNILDYKFNIVAWNKLYRSELFQTIRFPYGKLHEDEYIIPFLVEQCKVYVRIDNSYYAYVNRNNSIMNSRFNVKRLDIIGAYQERIKYFSDKYNKKYDNIIKYHFFVLCVSLKMEMKKEKMSQKFVEETYHRLFHELMHCRYVSLNKKVKLIGYKCFSYIMFHLQKRKKIHGKFS